MLRLDDTRDGLSTLVDYVLQAAERNEKLTRHNAPNATVTALAQGEMLIVENQEQARLAVLLAEALTQMRADLFPEDADDLDEPLTYERALVLVKSEGGLRPAARAIGVSATTISRALRQKAAAV